MAGGGGGGGGGGGIPVSIGDKIDKSGTTTAANVTLFDVLQPNGLLGIGTIVNTGLVNDLQLTETVVDKFGTTITVQRVITAGGKYLLDPQTMFGDDSGMAYPPFVEYKVQVQDGFAGSHTTYELHYSDVNPT